MTMDLPQRMDLSSLDIAAEKRDQLRRCLAATFPEIMAEDKIDLDQLRRVLGEWVEPDRERFGLNWPGKAACMKVIQAPSVATLKPCREESVDWDTTGNVFIEGDNLEVLKLLQKAYFGKIKMIYIDPPYNTGKEFIYPDKYAETLDTYLEYTGQKDSDGRAFSTNTDASGRFHSRWLSMMYPRLYLAKSLLREDGVIFISIDNNEMDNLKRICSEIFGEENFLGIIVWKGATDNNPTQIATEHEYMICFCKSKDSVAGEWKKLSDASKETLLSEFNRLKNTGLSNDQLQAAIRKFIRANKDALGSIPHYDRVDNRGIYTGSRKVHNPKPGGYKYDVCHPVTGRVCVPPVNGYRYPEQRMAQLIAENRILFGEDETQIIQVKQYLEDYEEKLSSVVSLDSRTGSNELEAIFDEKKVFLNPKPVDLLKTVFEFVLDKDDIALDFFAGSGTTAQAIFELNQQDNGRRKFVLVQLPEPTGREDLPTISCITRERIRRLSAIAREERGRQLNLGDKSYPDLGFRAFKLDRSNFRAWDSRTKDKEQLEAQLSLHIDHLSADSSSEDVLYELLLKDAFSLTETVQLLEVAGKEVYSARDGYLLVCLDKHLTQEVIDAMADRLPGRVICLDAGFQGNDQLKVNAVQTFKARVRDAETAIEFRTV